MFVFNFKLEKNFKNLIIKFVHNEERDFNILYHSKKILEKSKYKIISKIHFKSRNQTNNFYMAANISYKIVEEQLLLNNTYPLVLFLLITELLSELIKLNGIHYR
jgi:hypothetical protein